MSAQVTVNGGLPRDPELSFSKDGKAIARFTVGTSRRAKNKSDEWESYDQSYWDVTVFGDMAENICESLEKGSQVIVTGRMRQEKWQTKDGEDRTTWKLVADDVAVSCKWAKVTVSAASSGSSRPAQKNTYDENPPF
jgi:single-strand DNA-binding protein